MKREPPISPLEARRLAVAETIGCSPDDFTPLRLRAIEAGPIMDANRLYLPAGRLTVAEAAARERAGFEQC